MILGPKKNLKYKQKIKFTKKFETFSLSILITNFNYQEPKIKPKIISQF